MISEQQMQSLKVVVKAIGANSIYPGLSGPVVVALVGAGKPGPDHVQEADGE